MPSALSHTIGAMDASGNANITSMIKLSGSQCTESSFDAASHFFPFEDRRAVAIDYGFPSSIAISICREHTHFTLITVLNNTF